MTTTTTNFGWTVPSDTDLVKDGAAAIRTALGGVDTSFVDLKGGTTGQVLSKASGTDLDFTWVAQDDSNAIQNAIVDAKGDLIAASAADTPARLAVGTDGQVLTADSTAATGLKWATASGAGTWTTYTPTNSNITVGNGTQTARYVRTGKTVTVSYRLTFGSTTSFGGTIRVGMPSTSNSFANGFLNLTDNGTGNFSGGVVIDAASSQAICRTSKVDSTWAKWDDEVTNTSPFTWTTGDSLGFSITYEEQ